MVHLLEGSGRFVVEGETVRGDLALTKFPLIWAEPVLKTPVQLQNHVASWLVEGGK